MKDIWKAEPTAILALIQAAITLFVSFGLHLTNEQSGSIIAFFGMFLALINRTQVHSPSTVEAIKQAISEKEG